MQTERWKKRFGFPRACRVIKADAFASALRMRICAQSEHFAIQYCWDAQSVGVPQLGMMVPKRLARLAVQRNTVKRLIRESFRLRAAALPAGIWLVRLRQPLSPKDLTPMQKRLWGQQLEGLWAQARDFALSIKRKPPCP